MNILKYINIKTEDKKKERWEKTPQGIILYNPQSGTFYKIPDWIFQVKKAQ